MERRQSRRDMRICIADAQSRGVRGHAPPEIFLKIDQNLCNLVRFLTHLSNFYKSTESTFYSWKLFTHEIFLSGNTVREKRKSAERRNNYRLWTKQKQNKPPPHPPYYRQPAGPCSAQWWWCWDSAELSMSSGTCLSACPASLLSPGGPVSAVATARVEPCLVRLQWLPWW